MTEFIECESLNISYNIMGVASISYTIISDTDSPSISDSIRAGGITFDGVIMSVYTQPIAKTEYATNGPWYSTSVTMVATGT